MRELPPPARRIE
uniref:Uncharacterized protein n=1 Tax=Arundo donax TaxID=35708 RepID=A0A0A9AFH9_ARUDO